VQLVMAAELEQLYLIRAAVVLVEYNFLLLVALAL
jgi:hypothetical protein